MYTQTTKYGRVWKYDTFTFNVPELKELLKEGSGYLVSNGGGKQWLYLPRVAAGDYASNADQSGTGNFTIVIMSKMNYMDKLKKAQLRKEAKNEDRNVVEP